MRGRAKDRPFHSASSRVTEERDLEALNPSFLRPNRFVPLGAVLPVLLGLCGCALADGAAPWLPFLRDPLVLACLFICSVGVMLMLVPRLFAWNWDSRHFGAASLLIASIALLGAIPWLSILLYSRPALWLRLLLFVPYLAAHCWWAWRFVRVYRDIFADAAMRRQLYAEGPNCFYYVQKANTLLLEKKLKFASMPSAFLFLGCLALAFVSLFFAMPLVRYFGLPMPHLFLAIAAIPIDMMGVGLAVQGLLAFYWYPARLRAQTGKLTFVDVVSKPGR